MAIFMWNANFMSAYLFEMSNFTQSTSEKEDVSKEYNVSY